VQVPSEQVPEHSVAGSGGGKRFLLLSGASKAFKRGSNEAGRNESERHSLVKLSAERCLGGPSRSCHGEGKRQRMKSGQVAGPLRGLKAAARFERKMRNTGDPTWQQGQAKAVAIRPMAEKIRSREGVRGVHSTEEGVQDNAPEGRGPDLVTAVMEVSARAWLKNPKTPKTKYENSNAVSG